MKRNRNKASDASAPKRERAASTGEALDLTLDVKSKDYKVVEHLTPYLEKILDALDAYEDLLEKEREVNGEIAKRLNGAGVTEHVVRGEKHRVRRVNGSSPAEYHLYTSTPKKPREKAVVDLSDV